MWFEDDEVERLREVFNKEHPHKTPIPRGSADATWRELQQRFHEECRTGNASCIISRMIHKPKVPEAWIVNRYEWLSSDDIAAVEKEYMKLFGDYTFLGTVPIDFNLHSETGECLVSTLCRTRLDKLYDEGYHKIGIIFNTDPHDGPGEHWVALFADIRPELEHARITYFDSYAQKPEKEIQALMRRWKEELDSRGIHPKPVELSYNKTRHQFKNSECGMYCLYFHYCCLLGIPMEQRVPDDIVNRLRNLLFRRK